MDKIFQVEFSRGGKFRGKLLEIEAPETCQKFWESLPFEGKILHGAFTGLTMFFFVEFRVGKVENPFVCGGQAGDLFLNIYANGAQFEGRPLQEEIIIPYSKTGIFWNWAGLLPSNHFGKFQDNIEQLYQIGRRVKEQGAEIIHLSKA